MATGPRLLLLAAWTACASVHAAAIPERHVAPALLTTLEAVMEETHGFEDHFDAEVWLLDMRHRLAPFIAEEQQRFELLRLVQREAGRAGLSPELVLAVIQVESRFRPQAVSSAGAQGLMQIMPFWKEEIGRADDDLFDPTTNLEYGCTILAFYLRQEHGDMTRALARYNGSRDQTWYPERVMSAWTQRWWVSR